MIDSEFARAGAAPPFRTSVMATIAMALFSGLGVDSIVDPESITDETLDATLEFLYSTIGVDADDPNAPPPRGSP